ncbi:glycine-rich domain-containing protein [Paractinoplanes hotanensis]|uniref:Glycine-rich domain-containing protein-like n=1 Tax=Paractinoplanes hotanensis TaxID=2906497 RepID=A0ABT0YAM7_9ACTN|nr:hypothetical protein [Actinoplanes hotanensis]MCM4083091.1 hypothetical protein [Actinoplanes hotanensis]
MTDIVLTPVAGLTRGTPTEISTNRIAELPAVRRYIEAIDFTALKHRLVQKRDILGSEWSPARAVHAERCYKNWLYLRRRHESEMLPGPVDIEHFWHGHILDTRAYFEHCDRIFGYYLHHFPYFGGRGRLDRSELAAAWRRTQARYHAEFGEHLHDFRE